jgi:hypothetical protein
MDYRRARRRILVVLWGASIVIPLYLYSVSRSLFPETMLQDTRLVDTVYHLPQLPNSTPRLRARSLPPSSPKKLHTLFKRVVTDAQFQNYIQNGRFRLGFNQRTYLGLDRSSWNPPAYLPLIDSARGAGWTPAQCVHTYPRTVINNFETLFANLEPPIPKFDGPRENFGRDWKCMTDYIQNDDHPWNPYADNQNAVRISILQAPDRWMNAKTLYCRYLARHSKISIILIGGSLSQSKLQRISHIPKPSQV